MRYVTILMIFATLVSACGDSSGADAGRFCEILDELDAQNTTGLPLEEALPIIVEGRDKFEEGKSVAPDEINADAVLVADGAIRITDLLIAAGGDESQIDPEELQTAVGEVFTAEYEAAAESVNGWRAANCS